MQDILSKANSGDYEALRDLQSELFHRGNMAGKSILQSEKLAGETSSGTFPGLGRSFSTAR